MIGGLGRGMDRACVVAIIHMTGPSSAIGTGVTQLLTC